MNEEERYCLRWSNHQPTVMGVFDSLLRAESLVDVTLASEGKWLRAHRLVLSACSEYFQELLSFQPEKNAILYLRDVPFSHLEAIIAFMYRGEVYVTHSELSNFIKTADSLRIRGLSDIYQNQPKLISRTDEQSPETPVNRTTLLSQSSEAASTCATDSTNRLSNPAARRSKRFRSESPHELIGVRSFAKNGFQEKRIPVVQLTHIDALTIGDRRIPTTLSQSRNAAQVTLSNDSSTQSGSIVPVSSDQPPMVSIPAPTTVDPSIIIDDLLCNVAPKIEMEEVDLDAVTVDNTAGGGEEEWSDLEGQGTSHAELEGMESQEGTSTVNGAERGGYGLTQGRQLPRFNYTCQKCGQYFVLRKNFIKHMKNCAQLIAHRICKTCDTIFCSTYSLKRHSRRVHGINQGKKLKRKKSV